MNYPTPHINAKPEDFAKTVLMPGDPLRAKFIAENFLENIRLVNNVRSVQGYTGEYKGKKISVMASGMGMPSIAIYSHELFECFGVENIIRVGSAGAMRKDIKVRDIVLGMGACTNSNFAANFGAKGTLAPICSYKLLSLAEKKANELSLNVHIGNLLSSDIFYNEDEKANDGFIKMGVLAVEMEAAALYLNAMRFNKNALAICTISDNIITGEALNAEARQNSFLEMMKLSLETALEL